MTSRFVRPSKYRHTYTQQGRKEWNYENLKVSSSAWDTDLIKASPKFIAINYQASGGGAFAILPLLSPFQPLSPLPTPKLPDLIPLCRGHQAAVLDTAFSPHDPAHLVSAGEDGNVLVWNFEQEVSDGAKGSTTTEYAGKFEGWGEEGFVLPSDWAPVGSVPKSLLGGKKVGQVVFHPTAKGVVAMGCGDHTVRTWDLERGNEGGMHKLSGHKDSIQSLAWDWTGSTLITTSRDKKLRLFDPRAGSEAVRITDGHGGIKGSRVVWLGDRDRVVTTGFSKMSDRQMILWETGGLTSLKTETIDSSSGVIMPHYVEGNSVLLLAGKGDGNIRYFEYADDDLFYLSEHKSAEPQRGFTLLPSHAVDVTQNEIARGFKLTTSAVEPIAFVVPRKAESFQADIFPPARSMEPALTAKEWQDGKIGIPKMIDLESKSVSTYEPPVRTIKESTPTPSPSSPGEKVAIGMESKSTVSPETPSLRDVPVQSTATPIATATATATATRGLSGDKFDPKNLEIEQDDPESDEEITDAKRRAPADDFDDDHGNGNHIGDKVGAGAGAVASAGGKEGGEGLLAKAQGGVGIVLDKVQQVVGRTGQSQGSQVEEKKGVEEPVGIKSAAGQDDTALNALQTEITSLKKQLELAQAEAERYKVLLSKAKSLGKELAGL